MLFCASFKTQRWPQLTREDLTSEKCLKQPNQWSCVGLWHGSEWTAWTYRKFCDADACWGVFLWDAVFKACPLSSAHLASYSTLTDFENTGQSPLHCCGLDWVFKKCHSAKQMTHSAWTECHHDFDAVSVLTLRLLCFLFNQQSERIPGVNSCSSFSSLLTGSLELGYVLPTNTMDYFFLFLIAKICIKIWESR